MGHGMIKMRAIARPSFRGRDVFKYLIGQYFMAIRRRFVGIYDGNGCGGTQPKKTATGERID